MLANAGLVGAAGELLNQVPGQAAGEPGTCDLRRVALSCAFPEVPMADDIRTIDEEMHSAIKRNAGLGTVVGILVAVAGFLALLSPLVAGLSIALAVGVLLIISGVSRLFFAFKMGSFGQGLLVFVMGVLSVIVGGYMVSRPGVVLVSLTLFLAAYFFVHGVFEIVWAFRLRPIKGWGWALFSGVVALALGIMIWRQFPVSGAWAVGTLMGVQMIFGGWSVASICGAARVAAKEAPVA